MADEHEVVPVVAAGGPEAVEKAVLAAREALSRGRHAAVYSSEVRGGAARAGRLWRRSPGLWHGSRRRGCSTLWS